MTYEPDNPPPLPIEPRRLEASNKVSWIETSSQCLRSVEGHLRIFDAALTRRLKPRGLMPETETETGAVHLLVAMTTTTLPIEPGLQFGMSNPKT